MPLLRAFALVALLRAFKLVSLLEAFTVVALLEAFALVALLGRSFSFVTRLSTLDSEETFDVFGIDCAPVDKLLKIIKKFDNNCTTYLLVLSFRVRLIGFGCKEKRLDYEEF